MTLTGERTIAFESILQGKEYTIVIGLILGQTRKCEQML
jgi:hypothetical protein